MTSKTTRLPELLKKHEPDLVREWVADQYKQVGKQRLLMQEQDLRKECSEFLGLLTRTLQEDPNMKLESNGWQAVRDWLGDLSRSRATKGFSMPETATFVFSLKRPVFTLLRQEINQPETLADEVWLATELLDKLGLHTSEVAQKTREEIIARQQEEMMELSTPVVKLWDGILALPLIGTLDSARTQVVMEALLQKIVETGSTVAIIDITGVPTVDTLVAQHLLKTVTAARLMGADCIISGIRPQIAQTIVHLGVSLANVSTKASLADAFQLALQRTGVSLKMRSQTNGNPG